MKSRIDRLEMIETALTNAQATIREMVASISIDQAKSNMMPPQKASVSNTISKPRTFEDLEHLRTSVGNCYASRLADRRKELETLVDIDEEASVTGCIEIPKEMNDIHILWTIYLDLLQQYCDDVEDILAYGSRL